MKADVQYNDFIGTAAADLSDGLATFGRDDFSSIAKFLKLDEERFKLVGISIYGTKSFSLNLLCVDKTNNDKIVKLSYDVKNNDEILEILFKRLNIVLYEKYDEKYPDIEEYEYFDFSDFHSTEDNNEI